MNAKKKLSIWIIMIAVIITAFFIWNSQKEEAPKTQEEIQTEIKRLENLLNRLQEDTQRAEQGEAACILIYAPVCGTDGKTYSNDCFASAAGVGVDYEGECR